MVAVLTADLIDSSLYEEQVLQEVLDTLKQEFKDITLEYKEDNVRLQIYRGDSFQGIIKKPEDALKIALQIKTAINRIHLKDTVKNKAYSKIADFKIAIGIGEQDLEREAISESNGPAFQFSGRTLDEMKAENRKTRLKTNSEEINADYVLIASGSNTKVWDMVEKFGHSVVQPVPSLFTFNINDNRLKDIPVLVDPNRYF